MIVIIDYGMGNLHSVVNALNHLGYDCLVSNKIEDIKNSSKLILPGVGAFYDAMSNLTQLGLIDVIKNEVKQGKPLLGICLGMQALFSEGFEVKPCLGFDFIKGKVTLMQDNKVKIPHIGWNLLEINQSCSCFENLSKDPYMYFVHSYMASEVNDEDVIAYATYGDLKIPAMVKRHNVVGCQFHPEKSGSDGLNLLKWFVEEFK